jgi:hypothetical protein
MKAKFTPKKERAPKSQLQRANGEAQWAIHFKLQHFGTCCFRNLCNSKETALLVKEYNDVVDKLRASIQDDYNKQAASKRKRPLPKEIDKPIKMAKDAVFLGSALYLIVGDKEIKTSRVLKITKLKAHLDNFYAIETLNTIYHVLFSTKRNTDYWLHMLEFEACHLRDKGITLNLE